MLRHPSALLTLAIAWAGSNVASLAAFQRGPASLVAPVQATGVILTAILGVVFLHERTNVRQRLAAALVCCIGVALIVQ